MASGEPHFAFHCGPAAQASKLFLRNMESTSLCSESSVFSVQMWKAAGLTPKLVGKRSADTGTPSATPRYRGGAQQQFARSGLSSNSFSGFAELNPKSLKVAAIQAYETSVAEESAAQLSGSTGHSPAPKGADQGERDPISSTPRASRHHHHHHSGGGDPITMAEAALAARQRQVHQLARALQRCTSQGQVAMSGPGIAPDPRPCLICGISCLVYVTVPGVSAPLAPQPSLAASATNGAAVSAAVAQVTTVGNQLAGQSAASDPAAGSAPVGALQSGASSCAEAQAKPLQHAVSAPAAPSEPSSGPPPLIGCSQCRKPMHLDCFVAHYGVVPARRDYTYCPSHVYVPKPKPMAERKTGGGSSHGGAHKRERIEREAERKKKRRVEREPSPDEDYDDGDGDYVPRATTMRLRGTSPAPAPRRSAGARLRTRSSSNGGIVTVPTAAGSAANANGTGGVSADGSALHGNADGSDGGDGARRPARLKDAPAELHESRSGSPADRSPPAEDRDAQQLQEQGGPPIQPWAAAGADAAVSIGERLGSGGGSSVSGEQQQEGSEQDPSRGLLHPGDALAGLERVRVPKHQRSARTPRAAAAPALPGGSPRKAPPAGALASTAPAPVTGDAPSTPRSASKSDRGGERGRDAGGVRSPRVRAGEPGFSEERGGGRHAATVRRASGEDENGRDGGGDGKSAALRAAASGSLDGRPAHSQRDREQQPQSPRGGGGSSAARSAVKSPLKSQRPRDGSASKGEKAPRPSSAPVPDTPAPVAMPVTPTELNDEELARLLHEELNAPSRRRAAKRPGLPDAFTTPPLSPLGSAMLSTGGASVVRKQQVPGSADRRPASVVGTPVANGAAGNLAPSKSPAAAVQRGPPSTA